MAVLLPTSAPSRSLDTTRRSSQLAPGMDGWTCEGPGGGRTTILSCRCTLPRRIRERYRLTGEDSRKPSLQRFFVSEGIVNCAEETRVILCNEEG
jgi:hypothetical protein